MWRPVSLTKSHMVRTLRSGAMGHRARLATDAAVPRRRGAVLLETLLALAIFVAVAMITLGITGSAMDAMGRDRLHALAGDLASARFAELSAGTVSFAELRDSGTALQTVGSVEWDRDDFAATAGGIEWQLRASSQRSSHAGLSVVVLTVRALRGGSIVTEASVRGLLRLSEEDQDTYEDDELLDGLPDDESFTDMMAEPPSGRGGAGRAP